MEFRAEIKRTFTGPDKLRAVCSVILDDCFLVKNVRVVEGEKGLFVSLPSRRNVKGEWTEQCFPMTKELREKLGCDAVIHMDPVVTDDGVTEETRRRVQTLIHCIDDAIDIHDFRMVAGPTHTNLIFDAVVPFGFRLTDGEVEEKIRNAVRALDGNYYAVVNVERSYT